MLIVAGSVAAGALLVSPSPAMAAGVGYVRLAHLVPDKIVCDMYVHLNSVDGNVLQTLPSVEYGSVSSYKALQAGTYAVSMRKAGTPSTSPPALSTSVTVVEGKGYTIARIGAPDKPEARVIEDDRTPPGTNKAKVRVIQAAQRTLDVSVVNGPNIGSAIAFASATAYQEIDTGSQTFNVQPSGGQAVTVKQGVAVGSVYSILVTELTGGGVKATVLTDALRGGAVPKKGVQTGAGGTQRDDQRYPTALLSLGAVALVAVAGVLLVHRRRRLGVTR
jgi:hypothetical protein